MKYHLYRDGEFVAEFEYTSSGYCAFLLYMHRKHSFSVHHALTWEGYELREVKVA